MYSPPSYNQSPKHAYPFFYKQLPEHVKRFIDAQAEVNVVRNRKYKSNLEKKKEELARDYLDNVRNFSSNITNINGEVVGGAGGVGVDGGVGLGSTVRRSMVLEPSLRPDKKRKYSSPRVPKKVKFAPEIPHSEERKTKKPTPTTMSQRIEEADVESLWSITVRLLEEKDAESLRPIARSSLPGNSSLHDDNQRLRGERHALQSDNERLRGQRLALQSDNQRLRRQRHALRFENNELRSENASLKGSLSEMKKNFIAAVKKKSY